MDESNNQSKRDGGLAKRPCIIPRETRTIAKCCVCCLSQNVFLLVVIILKQSTGIFFFLFIPRESKTTQDFQSKASKRKRRVFVLGRTGKPTASHFGKFHSDPSLRRSKLAGRRTCFNKAARFFLCVCLTTRRATPALFPQRERRRMPDGSPEEQLALNFREQ